MQNENVFIIYHLIIMQKKIIRIKQNKINVFVVGIFLKIIVVNRGHPYTLGFLVQWNVIQ
jgi:hypothetical protein